MSERSNNVPGPVVVGALLLLAALNGGFALAGEGFGRSRSATGSAVMAVALVAVAGWYLLRRRHA